MARKIIPIGKSSIGIKCGDCIHFKRISKFEKPCSLLGRKHFADAPDCYAPDVYLLAKHNPEILFNLALLYKEFTAQETRVFMSLLKKSKTFEKAKLQFGMPVYFCVSTDYLSNFYRGFVLDVTSSGDAQTVSVTSDLSKAQRDRPMIGMFLRDSIYTVSEFKKKKVQLHKANRLLDPKPKFSAVADKSIVANIDYVPPSMDNAPREWFDKQDKSKAKSKFKGVQKSKRRLDGNLEFNVQ
jgi:hypothetical protein